MSCLLRFGEFWSLENVNLNNLLSREVVGVYDDFFNEVPGEVVVTMCHNFEKGNHSKGGGAK